MSSEHPTTPDAAGSPLIRHPVPWIAGAILLVNDHWLKGSGIVPGSITGKLSDFAWLILAPVVLAALIGARSRGASLAILGGFAGLFTVTELSQTAADQVSRLAEALGVPCRLWADPTDLMALAVLPITWHVMAQRHRSGPGRLDRALGRAALGLGIFASIATTNPPPRPATWNTGAFVVNSTGGAIDVRVRWSSAAIECAALSDLDLSVAVSGAIFDSAITYRLLEGETVPLERADATLGTGPMATGACQLALVAIDGAPDTIVLVPPDVVAVRTTQTGMLDSPERAVVITLGEAGFDLAVGEALNAGPRDDRLHASTCAGLREAFAASTSLPIGTDTVIVERSVGSDGCTVLRTEEGARTFLCVPEELVPFEVGGRLLYLGSTPEGLTRFIGDEGSLWIGRGTGEDPVVVGRVTLRAGPAEDCTGIRATCGGYAMPRPVLVDGATFDARGVAEVASARVAVGRAQTVFIAPSTCDAAYASLGTTFDFAVLQAP